MIQSLKEMLNTWNTAYSDRVKLQHAYIAIAGVGIIIAGLAGLVDDRLGELLVQVCIVALGVFIANILVWALLYSLVLTKLPRRNGRK